MHGQLHAQLSRVLARTMRQRDMAPLHQQLHELPLWAAIASPALCMCLIALSCNTSWRASLLNRASYACSMV